MIPRLWQFPICHVFSSSEKLFWQHEHVYSNQTNADSHWTQNYNSPESNLRGWGKKLEALATEP